jgi:hypothetical protein
VTGLKTCTGTPGASQDLDLTTGQQPTVLGCTAARTSAHSTTGSVHATSDPRCIIWMRLAQTDTPAWFRSYCGKTRPYSQRGSLSGDFGSPLRPQQRRITENEALLPIVYTMSVLTPGPVQAVCATAYSTRYFQTVSNGARGSS